MASQLIQTNSDPDTYQPVGSAYSNGSSSVTLDEEISESFKRMEAVKRRRNWRRPLARVIGALVVAGVAKLGADWWAVERWVESTDDAYVGGNITVIAPKVAGFIGVMAVEDNQHVRAGDLLLKINDRDYRAFLAKAKAATAIQKAALTNLEASLRWQEAMVGEAQATISAANAEIVRTRDDQSRYAELQRQAAVSVQEAQKAEADFTSALAIGERARAGLLAAQRQLEVIETQRAQIEAALQQAQAEEELARLNLSYTELRAPIDGYIGNRSGRVGAYAAVGSQLISLVPEKDLWIDANFKENQLAPIRPGAGVTIKIDCLPGKTFAGRVVSIAPATGAQFSLLPPENATGNFTKIVQRVPVRIRLDEDPALNGQLRPGLSVMAKVNTAVME